MDNEIAEYLVQASLVSLDAFRMRKDGESADLRRKIKAKRKELELLERELEDINTGRRMALFLRLHRDDLIRVIMTLAPQKTGPLALPDEQLHAHTADSFLAAYGSEAQRAYLQDPGESLESSRSPMLQGASDPEGRTIPAARATDRDLAAD